jgi:chemotaxis signal transduction protein
MSDSDDIRLDLLLFSVGGVHFGADAGQVVEIAVYGGEQADDLFWFHKELEYGDVAPTYFSPTVVTIRTGGVQPYRVIIDSMEDVAGFLQNDIRLFPALLEPFALKRGMWGILLLHGRMVLLVDFIRLLKERQSRDAVTPD